MKLTTSEGNQNKLLKEEWTTPPQKSRHLGKITRFLPGHGITLVDPAYLCHSPTTCYNVRLYVTHSSLNRANRNEILHGITLILEVGHDQRCDHRLTRGLL